MKNILKIHDSWKGSTSKNIFFNPDIKKPCLQITFKNARFLKRLSFKINFYKKIFETSFQKSTIPLKEILEKYFLNFIILMKQFLETYLKKGCP